MEARETLMNYCASIGDDKTLRSLQSMMKKESALNKFENATSTVILRKRAQEEGEAAAKRKKAFQDEKRLAANEENAKKEFLQSQKILLLQSQQRVLELKLKEREDLRVHEAQKIDAKAHARWLQTQYPAELAHKLISCWKKCCPQSRRKSL